MWAVKKGNQKVEMLAALMVAYLAATLVVAKVDRWVE